MSYTLESRSGDVYVKDSNVRIILMPTNTISKMAERFWKVLGPASKVMIMEVGSSLGKSMAELLGDGSKKEEVEKFLEKAGFGKATFEDGGDEVKVTFSSPPSEGVLQCYFEAGVVKGLLEALEGEKWRVKKVEGTKEGCVVTLARTGR